MILGGGTIILFLKATIFNRDQKPFDQFYSKVFYHSYDGFYKIQRY